VPVGATAAAAAVGAAAAADGEPEAFSGQRESGPPLPPVTSMAPSTRTSPVARRSSTPTPAVVTRTPARTRIVVK
jgi:hypothetical protein